ncbi:MAG: hypothetical protein IPJ77_23105 [Planctomycetes bacterium]|nr:hypothetical protein [Planctomycetota bacterium]
MHTTLHAHDAFGPNAATPDLHAELVDGLRTPLAALRASLETLAHRFEPKDPRESQVAGSLAQVVRLQHNLQTILDARQPVALRPLPCTLQEIASSAVNALVPELRQRVLVAVEGADARIVVDGPLVSRALTRLLECGLDQSAEPALLRVRAQSGRATFSVLHRRCDTPAGSIEALALHVAERDAARMGGNFHSRSTAEHAGVFELGFALAVAGEEAA